MIRINGVNRCGRVDASAIRVALSVKTGKSGDQRHDRAVHARFPRIRERARSLYSVLTLLSRLPRQAERASCFRQHGSAAKPGAFYAAGGARKGRLVTRRSNRFFGVTKLSGNDFSRLLPPLSLFLTSRAEPALSRFEIAISKHDADHQTFGFDIRGYLGLCSTHLKKARLIILE